MCKFKKSLLKFYQKFWYTMFLNLFWNCSLMVYDFITFFFFIWRCWILFDDNFNRVIMLCSWILEFLEQSKCTLDLFKYKVHEDFYSKILINYRIKVFCYFQSILHIFLAYVIFEKISDYWDDYYWAIKISMKIVRLVEDFILILCCFTLN